MMLPPLPALFKIPVRQPPKDAVIVDINGELVYSKFPKADALECQNCGSLFALKDWASGEFEPNECPICGITESTYLGSLRNG